ncbi:MAG: protein kinase, partial [Gammaproteobacteria bacterium]|nr:protein kinase [Gammaproteobacteria bacterium]
MKKLIANYNTTEKLYENSSSRVYRAVQIHDHAPVILKMLKPENPTPEALSRFQREYEITGSFHEDGIIGIYGLEKHHNTLIIIEEDIGAESLGMWMKRRRLTLEECLSLAVRIADSIEQIHAADVIHKDLNPSNIVWNPKTDQVKIIDFGIATPLTTESPGIRQILEGTLPYLSPEQTGRMNRLLDYRTDFYSLGITLYEMFTGSLPFDTRDAMEMVHCHLARPVTPPHHLNTNTPEAVSRIVMKLLAKTAEERYQSAHGLKIDLSRCLDQLRSTGTIEPFPLGQQDFTQNLRISQKIYGREQEIQTLLAAFERTSAGRAELMLVAGYSGIGKTMLVHEVQKPMV